MGASGAGINWSNFPILQIIGFLLLAIVIVALVAFLTYVKKKKNKLISEIKEKLEGKTLLFKDTSANFFGQESKKYKQIRGNGILIITDTVLMFFMFLPKKEIKIELSAINNIETPSTFLGKSVFRPLLKVTYLNENGKKDSVAWFVKDLESVLKIFKEKNLF